MDKAQFSPHSMQLSSLSGETMGEICRAQDAVKRCVSVLTSSANAAYDLVRVNPAAYLYLVNRDSLLENGDSLRSILQTDRELEDVITALNLTCRALMQSPVFQAELITLCTRWTAVIGILREFQGKTGYAGCCCCVTPTLDPFGGCKRIQAAAERLAAKTSQIKASFSMNIDIQGAATFAGQTGSAVQIQNVTRVMQVDGGSGVTVMNGALPIAKYALLPSLPSPTPQQPQLYTQRAPYPMRLVDASAVPAAADPYA